VLFGILEYTKETRQQQIEMISQQLKPKPAACSSRIPLRIPIVILRNGILWCRCMRYKAITIVSFAMGCQWRIILMAYDIITANSRGKNLK
jgi:hypothetical protein